ncbi:MAG: hypothetical protein GYB53_19285 [Rhodobacteraceae bacterium]|nr:hypothetical protein [Paracoccaceae bacterium]MBR9823566.1 hypothetical protein [Paracoccaceae bacterium]
MFYRPFFQQPFAAVPRSLLRLALVAAALSVTLADPAVAQRWGWGGGNGNGGGHGGGQEEEEPPVEETGITHIIYFIGFAFFPNQVHVQKGDTLMFTNLTNQNQMVEADDGSWASGWLGYRGTYPIMLDRDTDLDFTGKTYYQSGWYNYSYEFSGEAVETELETEANPRSFPYLSTSLAETFNVTEAVRRIEVTRQHVWTTDEYGNTVTPPPSN